MNHICLHLNQDHIHTHKIKESHNNYTFEALNPLANSYNGMGNKDLKRDPST